MAVWCGTAVKTTSAWAAMSSGSGSLKDSSTDAGQGRKDLAKGLPGYSREWRAISSTPGWRTSNPHQLQPGIAGGAHDRDFDLFHGV